MGKLQNTTKKLITAIIFVTIWVALAMFFLNLGPYSYRNMTSLSIALAVALVPTTALFQVLFVLRLQWRIATKRDSFINKNAATCTLSKYQWKIIVGVCIGFSILVSVLGLRPRLLFMLTALGPKSNSQRFLEHLYILAVFLIALMQAIYARSIIWLSISRNQIKPFPQRPASRFLKFLNFLISILALETCIIVYFIFINC